MYKFCEVLNDLVQEKEDSVFQISLKSGVSSTQFYKYLKGFYPSIDVAVRISNYFGCSLDYLFGLSDDRYKKYSKEYDMSGFIGKYQKLLRENNISNWKFSQVNGFSESGYRRWRKGQNPNIETLFIIANELSSSMDYLIGRELLN